MPAWIEFILDQPFVGQAIRLLLLAVMFLLVRRALRISSRQIERRIESTVMEADRRRRLYTLLRAGYATVMVALSAIVAIMALQLIGLRIEPLLASAGVAGLAVSLGAQSIIRDYIGGALILAEDQFRVGDVIEVGAASGEVVRMTLRVTYLRNHEGKLISVPNGDIRTLSNLTREWSRAIVDLNLDAGVQWDVVQRALDASVVQLRAEPALKDAVLGPAEIINWNTAGTWAVHVRVMVRTMPGKQWSVGSALRAIAVERLAADGIRAASPTTPVRHPDSEP